MKRRREPAASDLLAAFQVVHVVGPNASDYVNTHAPEAFVEHLTPSSLRAALADPRDRDLVLAAVERLVDTHRLPADWRDLGHHIKKELEA